MTSTLTPPERGAREHMTVTVAVELEHLVAVRLRRAAAVRDVPVKRLINNLLDTIATDHLIDAVLDDGEPS